MSRGFKRVITAICAAVLVATIFAMLPHRKRATRLERYLCDQCAMQREVISKWWLGVPVGSSDTTTLNSLSREISVGSDAKCQHKWVRIYFDHHGTRVMGHGGVTSRFAIHYLTEDKEGAAGLMEYCRATDHSPEMVWHTLFEHLANVPDGESSAFETWLFEGNARGSHALASWLQDNYESLSTNTNL